MLGSWLVSITTRSTRATGVVAAPNRYPSGATGDFAVLIHESRRGLVVGPGVPGSPMTPPEVLAYTDPSATIRAAPGTHLVDVPDPVTGRRRWPQFADLDEYHRLFRETFNADMGLGAARVASPTTRTGLGQPPQAPPAVPSPLAGRPGRTDCPRDRLHPEALSHRRIWGPARAPPIERAQRCGDSRSRTCTSGAGTRLGSRGRRSACAGGLRVKLVTDFALTQVNRPTSAPCAARLEGAVQTGQTGHRVNSGFSGSGSGPSSGEP